MIVLGKDKINEDYNIDDNGVITDLNGNVQELKMHQGYLEFKGIGIHKIQIWSRSGWFNGRKFVVHHIDENKLNNNINNLKILSHAQHTYVHKKGKTWTISEEGRNNISKATKGENNPMYGKIGYWAGKIGPNVGMHHSEEAKRKIGDAMKKYWENKRKD